MKIKSYLHICIPIALLRKMLFMLIYLSFDCVFPFFFDFLDPYPGIRNNPGNPYCIFHFRISVSSLYTKHFIACLIDTNAFE
jgi:hypothetical protein